MRKINKSIFQFPSHRDVLCDCNVASLTGITYQFFQFPSHRDVLCDRIFFHFRDTSDKLSVPFSSGCALRPSRMACSVASFVSFSSLLIGMCFATMHLIKGTGKYRITFSSLLIGMCFATGFALCLLKLATQGFQFPSHRDVLCDDLRYANLEGADLHFQFPSHRDVLCDSESLAFSAASHLHFQFPSHRDVLCDRITHYRITAQAPQLSVPFSSGCALRLAKVAQEPVNSILSVPFSSGCALRRRY